MTNPFADTEEVVAVPAFKAHMQTDSFGSSSSGNTVPSEHAMKSLIAALDLTKEEVEERLRVASMQPSTMSMSRYSGSSHFAALSDEDDLSTIHFPVPPSTSTTTT